MCPVFPTPGSAPAPLPALHVWEAPPFTNTGVDFAGPLYVKNPGGAQSKVWIALYTCCVTEAIHLELVPDMSAPAFIWSFKRFSSRRGLPALIMARSWSCSQGDKSVVSSPEIQRYFDGVGIEWRFNVPRAPWWGGVFERLVCSTKRCLRKVLGQAKFSHDELLTAVVETEMVLNSKPLIYVSADDLLTPSHLLIGRRLISYPDHLLTTSYGLDSDEDGHKLNACLKHQPLWIYWAWDTEQPASRPRRSAATQARDRILAQAMSE